MVLVAEETPLLRRRLSTMLRRHGYRVIAVPDGFAALEAFEAVSPNVVIFDEVMPGLGGLELCARIRARNSHPVYMILLSTRDEAEVIVRGVEAGAHDHVRKPIRECELLARVGSGLRALERQRSLAGGERRLREDHARLLREHEAMRKDLAAAAGLQRALMPAPIAHCNGVVVSCGVKACDLLSGDLVGSCCNGGEEVVIYSIDVAGHGAAAALLSIAIAEALAPVRSPSSLIFSEVAPGANVLARPHDVVAALGRRFGDWANSDRYFTIAYSIIDLRRKRVEVCIAGHPAPAIVTAGGKVRYLGNGGSPVGLLPNSRYESISCDLNDGDSLILYSDAFVDARYPSGARLGQDGLAALISEVVLARPRNGIAAGLIDALTASFDSVGLTDDASVIAATI